MAKPIQAGSLASVIELADNPPDQPLHSLTGDLQQPLVLYIARVPGSHGICFSVPDARNMELMETPDVFLTTMKPQQKVVTAQDVQSSLYYMHVDKLEDYELLTSSEDSEHHSDEEDGPGKPVNPTSTGGVRRKPLPPSSRLGLGDRLEPPPEANSYFQTYSNSATGSPQAEQKPSSQDNVAEHRRLDVSPPLPDRKLLGPRPMHQHFLSVDNPPLQDVPEKQNIDLRRWSEQPAGTPPKLPPRPFSGGNNSVPMAPPRPLAASLKDSLVANSVRSRFLHRKPIAHSVSQGSKRVTKDGSNAKDLQDATLSLIRRYNNEQWTVGKISSKDTKPTVSGFGESSHGISIHIMTHGYLRFVDHINSFAKHARPDTEKSKGTRDNRTTITAAEEQLCFQRHLQVPGHAMSWNQRRRPESIDSTFLYQGTRPSVDLPRHSHQSLDSIASDRSFTNGLPELKSESTKGYILRSPWDGICEFTTGVAGRSFKCKHSYASSSPRFGPGMRSAQVSELRFNLPSSKTLGSPASKSLVPGTRREAKRSSSLFPHQHRQRSSSSFEAKDRHEAGYFAPKVEFEERLDLSLGQEHAGGGFGGKQAKLGKLIIEKEGLQMLDLIVAANMALWWRVYERFTFT
ncbi:hypothetical protein HO173_001021 [Letharia columbiana]|uniref:Uncharacterized protein n=1 Tax=Letharia columbiana TaxID=112416 RepID=A0A8H6G698_9LECA|nr:uncharacterized protein HO173_001021 [Letharia columbiana]KAF6241226.1 hypothetical protein HO173_001021 [Letharia columbiana]